MKKSISEAQSELKMIDRSPAQTAGAKRVRKRNMDALGSWISVMKDHLKDLTCGIAVAATQPAAPAPTPAPTPAAPVAEVTPAVAETGENLAAGTKEKGVNWLLIGGLVVGGLVIYKLLKK